MTRLDKILADEPTDKAIKRAKKRVAKSIKARNKKEKRVDKYLKEAIRKGKKLR